MLKQDEMLQVRSERSGNLASLDSPVIQRSEKLCHLPVILRSFAVKCPQMQHVLSLF